jgi:hypothetical protein
MFPLPSKCPLFFLGEKNILPKSWIPRLTFFFFFLPTTAISPVFVAVDYLSRNNSNSSNNKKCQKEKIKHGRNKGKKK